MNWYFVNHTDKRFNRKRPINHQESENEIGNCASYESFECLVGAQTDQFCSSKAFASEKGKYVIKNYRKQNEQTPSGSKIVTRHDSFNRLTQHKSVYNRRPEVADLILDATCPQTCHKDHEYKTKRGQAYIRILFVKDFVN